MVTVTSTANPAVKAARKLARRSGRAKAGQAFLVEGPQAVTEAVPFLARLFVTPQAAADNAELLERVRGRGVEIVPVADPVLAELATTVTPQGLVGVASLEQPDLTALVAGARLMVVLHQVRDPGNAGTAIRTADAAGADGVVLTAGSVDAHNPKAVRSSAGSLFHLPVVADVPFAAVASTCREHGVRLVAAAGDAPVVHTATDLTGPVALVFGNEAHGLPPAVQAACDDVVRVPRHDHPRAGYAGTAESLNLAATVAVLAYESVRQAATAAGPVPHAPAPTR